MPKPRDIREKTLLSLFAYTCQQHVDIEAETWNLSLEPEQAKIHKLSVKALKHQLAGLPKWATQFTETAPLVAPMMKTYDLKTEARTLLSVSKTIDTFLSQFNLLGALSKSDELSRFFIQGKALHATLSQLVTSLEASSFTAPELTKLLKATIQLKDLCLRVDYVASPLSHSEQTSISALVKAASDQNELREHSEAMLQGIARPGTL